MTPLAALLRSARPADPADDAALLGRLPDADAFAELVRRHGRLVWAACRHQTRSEADADDCFQAVWLALLRRPAAVRQPAKLSAFLHAVAVRVCRKQRASNDRRTARERAVASADGGTAVPDSAWDRALAAVHEEVAALPEPLRVAFVRCGLEGQGVTTAAAELGWKLGTLSGRLTRAKELLAKRLDARGLTAGAVAATTCGGLVPAAVAGRTAELVAGTVPASILTLSQGVVVMSRAKLLAAGLLVASGLGGCWLASVGAQDKPSLPLPKPTAAKPAAEKPASKWEYYYHEAHPDQGVSPGEFQDVIEQKEAEGWTFLTAWHQALVFRRPVKVAAVVPAANSPTPLKPNERLLLGREETFSNGSFALTTEPFDDPDPKARQQKIELLEKELARLKAAGPVEPVSSARYSQKNLPLGAHELRDMIDRLARMRFGDDKLILTTDDTDGGALNIRGPKSRVEWAGVVLQALTNADALKPVGEIHRPDPTVFVPQRK